MIPFNKPYLTGEEKEYIDEAISYGKLSGNGVFTKKCQSFFENKYDFKKCLLTTSCTDALEMAAILLDIKEGDEVIIPSYTFVSTANAFVLRGAKVIFCDSKEDFPNIDETKIESLITKKTKAIVIVHYAGVACNMDYIADIVNKYNLFLIEDAAQAIDSYYKGIPLGSFGHMSAFSFHETKNIICGEGGMLVINHDEFINRAEIIWEKGTNRAAFWRGEVDKYNWVDIGSSFLPSELNAAFLYAQILHLEDIQRKRSLILNRYLKGFEIANVNDKIRTLEIPHYSTNNAHMFFLICDSLDLRNQIIDTLREKDIYAVFHYLPLHRSPYYLNEGNEKINLKNADFFSDHLVRLPLFPDLSEKDQDLVINLVLSLVSKKL